MELQEFIDNHYEGGGTYSDDPNINFTCVEQGDAEDWGKSVIQTSVYNLDGTEEYFEVTESWSNSGYWSNPERYEPEFRKVKPVTEMVPVARWLEAD